VRFIAYRLTQEPGWVNAESKSQALIQQHFKDLSAIDASAKRTSLNNEALVTIGQQIGMGIGLHRQMNGTDEPVLAIGAES